MWPGAVMQVPRTDDGLEAIVFTAQGDMRQVSSTSILRSQPSPTPLSLLGSEVKYAAKKMEVEWVRGQGSCTSSSQPECVLVCCVYSSSNHNV